MGTPDGTVGGATGTLGRPGLYGVKVGGCGLPVR